MDQRLRCLGFLRCFDAAARNKSYSLAAKELSVSQAAVSQQVRNLERSLAVKLFIRDGRSMKLTVQGESLHQYVTRAFNELSNGFNHIQVEPEDGVLVVSTTLSFATIWLVPSLWKFADLHPGIKVKVMVSDELEDVQNSGVDIAIRQGESVAQGVSQKLLFTGPVSPVCSPRLLEKHQLTSPELLGCCQLIEVQNSGEFSWQNWHSIAGINFNSDRLSWIEATSWEMAINAVLTGQGMCLASSIMVNDLIDKGLLVRPFEVQIEPGLRFTFIHDSSSPRVKRIDLFHSWLKAELDSCLKS